MAARMPSRSIALIVGAVLLPSAASAQPSRDARPSATPTSIGSASEEADGTIVLTLRASGTGGLIGDGQLRYPPTHPQYRAIRAHVGPIPRGGSVPVKPFPPK